jgi:hypothetical protein
VWLAPGRATRINKDTIHPSIQSHASKPTSTSTSTSASTSKRPTSTFAVQARNGNWEERGPTYIQPFGSDFLESLDRAHGLQLRFRHCQEATTPPPSSIYVNVTLCQHQDSLRPRIVFFFRTLQLFCRQDTSKDTKNNPSTCSSTLGRVCTATSIRSPDRHNRLPHDASLLSALPCALCPIPTQPRFHPAHPQRIARLYRLLRLLLNDDPH